MINPYIQINVEFKEPSGQSRNVSQAFDLISALATAE
jgi:hypothetical protein